MYIWQFQWIYLFIFDDDNLTIFLFLNQKTCSDLTDFSALYVICLLLIFTDCGHMAKKGSTSIMVVLPTKNLHNLISKGQIISECL